MNKFYLSILCVCTFLFSHSQELDSRFPTPNGTVNATVRLGNTLYVGGDFTSVGKDARAGVALDHYLGTVRENFPKFSGDVSAAIPDGKGGWFVAGSFVTVNLELRKGLAHVNADGTLNPWTAHTFNFIYQNVGINGGIGSMSLFNNVLYVAGQFGSVGTVERSTVAAFDATTGELLPWYPKVDPTAEVRVVEVANGLVYMGGSFQHVKGVERYALAAVDLVNGNPTPWNPGTKYDGTNVTITINDIAIKNNTAYVGGWFTSVGGAPRNNLAAVDLTTGLATDFNPNVSPNGVGNPSSTVSVIRLTNDRIYAAGGFQEVNGQPRKFFVALNYDGQLLPFAPEFNGPVYTIEQVNNSLYVGGDFTKINNITRNHIAGINATTGEVTQWNPDADARVATLVPIGNTVFAGGNFTFIGGLGLASRFRLAAYDLSSGKLLPWAPTIDGTVYAMVTEGSKVIIGGDFVHAVDGGTFRNGLAAIDPSSGEVLPQQSFPKPGSVIRTLFIQGNTMYMGGNFTQVNDQPRQNLAAVNIFGFALESWAPAANGQVNSLVSTGLSVYLGGEFSAVNGVTRSYIGAVDASSNLLNWNPGANGPVNTLTAADNTIYAGGIFTMIGFQNRHWLAALNGTDASVLPWNPDPQERYGSITTTNGAVSSLSVLNDLVYVGGQYTFIGGQFRSNLSSVSRSSGSATSWIADAGGPANTVVLYVNASTDKIFAGGNFTNIQYQPVSYLAVFNNSTGTPSIRPVSSLSEISTLPSATAYPNPAVASTKLLVRAGVPGDAQYILTDVIGRPVKQVRMKLQGGLNTIDVNLSGLTPGTYFIVLQHEGRLERIKIIKQ